MLNIVKGGKLMRKYPLIVISLCAVVLIVLGSLNNVVGYQSVQTSQQNLIKERINQRELLFQTFVDIVNNKEIQRIILKSQMSRGIFPTSELPVLTKNQLKMMYFLGLILSKVINKSRIQSMIGEYQFNNLEMQKEMSAVLEKDTKLKIEITQLSIFKCDCEDETIASEHLLLCLLLYPLASVGMILYLLLNIPWLLQIMLFIGYKLSCFWT